MPGKDAEAAGDTKARAFKVRTRFHRDRMYFSVGAFDDEVHSVEHLHLHAPLADDRRVRVQGAKHISRPKDRNVRERFFYFLLTDPLRP